MSLYDDLQEQLDEVHRYDSYFMALCPKHGDQRPSLLVSESRQRFHCLACGFSGSLEYLTHWLTGQSHSPTIRIRPINILPQWKRWAERLGDEEQIAAAAHGLLVRNPELQTFFKHRQIEQFIEQGMFGWLDGWISFPVLDRQRKVIDIVVRGYKNKGGTKYVLLKKPEGRASPPLYVPNWKRVLENDTVYVVYGIIDSWALESIGLPVVTGTTGKSLHADLLLPLHKRWLIVPDRGEESDAWRLRSELGYPSEVRELNFPYPCKDPDDIRTKVGSLALSNLLMYTE